MIVEGSGPHVVKALRERVAELEAELADLKASLVEVDGDEDWYRLGLSQSEMRIFNVLRKRKISTTRQLLFALYPNDPDKRAETDIGMIRVVVSNIRKKVAAKGLAIQCRRNVGWWLTPLPQCEHRL